MDLNQLIAFNDELVALSRAGVPLDSGLAQVGRDLPRRLGAVTAAIGARLERGESLEHILADRQAGFPPIYRAVVAAGVRSGKLTAAAEGLATSLRHLAELRRVVGFAMLYPLLVVIVASILFATCVQRVFQPLLDTLQTHHLSEGGRLESWIGFMADHGVWWASVPGLVLVLASGWWWQTSRAPLAPTIGRGWNYGWVPGARRMLRAGQMATFTEVLQLLVRHGIPLPESIALAAEATGGDELRRDATELSRHLEMGQTSGARSATGRGIPAVIGFLLSAEQPDRRLEQTLGRLARGYYRRAQDDSDWLYSTFPALATLLVAGSTAFLYVRLIFYPVAGHPDADGIPLGVRLGTFCMSGSLDKQLLEQLAELASAGMPLEAGLRAAAEEAGNSRLARQLRKIADRLRAGEDLVAILTGQDAATSPFTRAAIRSGIAARDVGYVLVELSELEGTRRDLRRRLATSLAYPLLLLMLLACLLAFACGVLIPAIDEAFGDAEQWGTAAAASMSLLRWVARSGVRYAGLGLVACLGLGCLARLVLGPARWRWLLTTLPVFGPILQWEAVWDFATRLQLLISRQVSLPEALRIVGEEMRDANLADVAGRLAAGTAAGRSLRELMQGTTRVPATLTAVLGWGEQQNWLGESLAIAAAIFHGRLRLRIALLASILPPLVYVVVAAMTVTLVAGLLMPLVTMVQGLSSFSPITFPIPSADLPLLGANWLGLSFLGAVLWWSVHLMFLDQQHPPENFLPFALRVTALLLIFFGATGLVFSLALPLAFPTVLAMLIVAAMVANRYRANETRALLWQLDVAQGRGMPLIPAARALGAERTDDLGVRMLRMVEQMEQGVPFPAALAAARLPTTTETALAAQIGLRDPNRTAAVDDRLARSGRELDESTALLQRLIYFCCVTAFGVAAWIFLWTRTLPTYQQIFADYGVELPALTRALIGWQDSSVGSVLLVLGTAIALVLFLATIPAVLYYIGWLRWEPPVIRPVSARYHGAIILRILSGALAQQRSLQQSLSDITTAYPVYYVRQRLVAVMEAVERGQDWIEALERARLISDVTCVVLKSAERVGNLPWALREMADSAFRRVLLRVLAVMQICTPLILLLIAIPIGIVVVAMFAPLPNLVLEIAAGYWLDSASV